MGFNSAFKGLNLPLKGSWRIQWKYLTSINKPNITNSITSMQGKGKAIPLQAWTHPGDSRRLRLPDFKIIST